LDEVEKVQKDVALLLENGGRIPEPEDPEAGEKEQESEHTEENKESEAHTESTIK